MRSNGIEIAFFPKIGQRLRALPPEPPEPPTAGALRLSYGLIRSAIDTTKLH